ncbi:MAG: hypothetical protein QGH42_10390 [Kiritimatiellia bacterium]|jgi:hypothetical protein|nr:hypothetical protein [Kiritimatiellia bacterium]MDP6630619.1 hypothetical protein [Kiritimatiellia bacterium]MDP6811324.1 hypothetical protein [Kiritimatiellia bacterium]MDP7024630.1 hypothetical protein [Kiritimatiellia bacterium]
MKDTPGQNVTTTFPGALEGKCLRLEAAGSGLDRAMITIPARVKPGQPFGATVALLDANAMPLIAKKEHLTLSLAGVAQAEVSFPAGHSAVARLEGLTQPDSGYFRLQAEIDGRHFVSNPSLATDEERPLVLWGDPHIHTTVGDCHAARCRTRTLAYAAARYAYGLDFIAIADHVSWQPRGTAGKWKDNLALCELYDEPGTFSALYCYETSMRGGDGGDCNVYLRRSKYGAGGRVAGRWRGDHSRRVCRRERHCRWTSRMIESMELR